MMRHRNRLRRDGDRRVSRPGLVARCGVVLAFAWGGSSIAAEPVGELEAPLAPPPASEESAMRRDAPPRVPALERGPLAGMARRGQLGRRVAFELSSLDAMRVAVGPTQPVRDHVLYDDMVERVERGVEKATRRALGEYLLESTNMDDVIARFGRRSGVASHRTAGTPRGFGDRTDFNLRVYSGMPLLEMRYGLDQSMLRLRLSPTGSIGFDIGDRTMERTRLSFGFDGDDTFHVGCRIGL